MKASNQNNSLIAGNIAQSWSDLQILNQLKSGQYWSNQTISYSFPKLASDTKGDGGEQAGFIALNNSQKSSAQLALMAWDDLISPSVIESTISSGNITFGMTNTGIEFAHAYYPLEGAVWFNRNEKDLIDPFIGTYGFFTYLHETGHALGLDHMGTYDGEQVDQPSCWQDSSVYSIMSYFGPSNNSGGQGQVAWANWKGSDGIEYSPQTPMINDVMAIQNIYGAANTREENTVYGFDTSISGRLGEIYNFSQNLHPILCIYDGGGVDTLNLSGYSTNSTVDLIGGIDHFSSCNNMTNNIQIARDVLIENAITGSGQDTLIGNQVANLLIAGAGNDLLQGNGGGDLLDGGEGIDTALYLNDIQNYRISFNGNSFQVTEKTQVHDSVDTLQNIEQIQFANITETVHNAILSDGGVLFINGLYQTYQIAVGNEYVVLSDLVPGRSGITLYSQVDRVKFNDLVSGLDVGKAENTGEVYRLYLTVLGRNPESDPVGCGFWIDKLDRNILTAEQMVGNFLNSTEFVTRFGGTTNTNESFVNLMYLNLLGRDGHPDSGFSFWLNVLNNNQASREQVVVGFMESPENIANAAPLIGDAPTYQQWTG